MAKQDLIDKKSTDFESQILAPKEPHFTEQVRCKARISRSGTVAQGHENHFFVTDYIHLRLIAPYPIPIIFTRPHWLLLRIQ
jgi:hypothetical protein